MEKSKTNHTEKSKTNHDEVKKMAQEIIRDYKWQNKNIDAKFWNAVHKYYENKIKELKMELLQSKTENVLS